MDVHCYENETVRIEWHTKLYFIHSSCTQIDIYRYCVSFCPFRKCSHAKIQADGEQRNRDTVFNSENTVHLVVSIYSRTGYVIKIPFLLCLDLTV